MTTKHYHNAPTPISTRPRCPVCHEAVYSPAGIHPQCAVRQAEPPRAKVVIVDVPAGHGPGDAATCPEQAG